ncbi:Pleiotropic drug resistance protein 1 [Platanthera guangdongensis]|uniref:Pleiotropic drug resistance protein 1 n=1 Tax=Platanthera guangdongensis TaxID=2320717 RepID=A0ABR2MCE2_9ASPA
MGDGLGGSVRSWSKSRSLWRSGGVEDIIFAGSLEERREDDEEALIWAALEKLSTYDRVRKWFLSIADQEGLKEVGVRSLTLQERRSLLERLLKVAQENHEKFLLKLRHRIDRVGIDFPTIELRFEHLNIEAEAYVGSRSLPSFLNTILNSLETFANYFHIIPSKKKPFTILHDISGIIKLWCG